LPLPETLDRAIETAIAEHPSLKGADFQIDAARYGVNEQASAGGPGHSLTVF